MNVKIALVLTIAMLAVSTGEMLLSYGMKEFGEVSIRSLGDVSRLLSVVFRNRYILIGILLLFIYFYSFLSLLSWADLSFVLPLTSISFILGTLLARFVLHEEVTIARWIGTIIICIGIALVAAGQAKTEKRETDKASPVKLFSMGSKKGIISKRS